MASGIIHAATSFCLLGAPLPFSFSIFSIHVRPSPEEGQTAHLHKADPKSKGALSLGGRAAF
jgi:hypothetical protein